MNKPIQNRIQVIVLSLFVVMFGVPTLGMAVDAPKDPLIPQGVSGLTPAQLANMEDVFAGWQYVLITTEIREFVRNGALVIGYHSLSENSQGFVSNLTVTFQFSGGVLLGITTTGTRQTLGADGSVVKTENITTTVTLSKTPGGAKVTHQEVYVDGQLQEKTDTRESGWDSLGRASTTVTTGQRLNGDNQLVDVMDTTELHYIGNTNLVSYSFTTDNITGNLTYTGGITNLDAFQDFLLTSDLRTVLTTHPELIAPTDYVNGLTELVWSITQSDDDADGVNVYNGSLVQSSYQQNGLVIRTYQIAGFQIGDEPPASPPASPNFDLGNNPPTGNHPPPQPTGGNGVNPMPVTLGAPTVSKHPGSDELEVRVPLTITQPGNWYARVYSGNSGNMVILNQNHPESMDTSFTTSDLTASGGTVGFLLAKRDLTPGVDIDIFFYDRDSGKQVGVVRIPASQWQAVLQ